MGNVSIFSRLPVLRLLLPLVVGIVLFRISQYLWLPIVLLAISIALLVTMRLWGSSPSKKLRTRNIRIVPLSLTIIVVGWFAAWVAEPVRLDINKLEGKTACGRIETIKYNEQSMLMQVKLLNASNDDKSVRGAHILLSTRGCDYDFVAGNLVAFKLTLCWQRVEASTSTTPAILGHSKKVNMQRESTVMTI